VALVGPVGVECRQDAGQGALLIAVKDHRVCGGAVVGQAYRSVLESLGDEVAVGAVAAAAEQGHAVWAVRDRWRRIGHVAYPVCSLKRS